MDSCVTLITVLERHDVIILCFNLLEDFIQNIFLISILYLLLQLYVNPCYPNCVSDMYSVTGLCYLSK